MTESQAREEICRVGRSLFERGYVHASAGNISVRLEEGFLITPTDACLGFLQPGQLAKVDLHGVHVSGERPSKTLLLHRHIYQAAHAFDPDTRCVIHTHSSHCVALSLTTSGNELIDAITPYFVMKVGRVPLIPYFRPGDQQAAESVAQTISSYGARGTPIRAVMLSRLGPNVWHDSPATAMATLEELEETAKLVHLVSPPPAPLAEDEIQALRQTFGARW